MDTQSRTRLIAEKTSALFSYLEQSLALSPVPLLSARQLEQLSTFLEQLQEWTTRIDLVAPAEEAEQVERHIVDAAAAAAVIAAEPELHGPILDVGSGAGLPGIVFAVLWPDLPVFLCEPRTKRSLFLKEMRRLLGLANVTVLTSRIEQLTAAQVPGVRLVTERALGLATLYLRECPALLPRGGYAAQLLGPSSKTAVPAPAARVSLWKDIPYSLSASGPGRNLRVWSVSRETP